MYVCVYLCVYVRVYLCVYVRVYLCVYVRVYLCVYVRVYLCVYVLASSPVPLFSRTGRRAARFARGRKKKGLVSTVCACAGFSWNSMKQ